MVGGQLLMTSVLLAQDTPQAVGACRVKSRRPAATGTGRRRAYGDGQKCAVHAGRAGADLGIGGQDHPGVGRLQRRATSRASPAWRRWSPRMTLRRRPVTGRTTARRGGVH